MKAHDLQIEPQAVGLGKAVFYKRSKFVGWAGLVSKTTYGYEVANTHMLSKDSFPDEATAVQALYESWSGNWRRRHTTGDYGD